MPRPEGQVLQFPGGNRKEQPKVQEGREVRRSQIVERRKGPEKTEEEKYLDLWLTGDAASHMIDSLIEIGINSSRLKDMEKRMRMKLDLERLAKDVENRCPKEYLLGLNRVMKFFSTGVFQKSFEDDFVSISKQRQDVVNPKLAEKQERYLQSCVKGIRRVLLRALGGVRTVQSFEKRQGPTSSKRRFDWNERDLQEMKETNDRYDEWQEESAREQGIREAQEDLIDTEDFRDEETRIFFREAEAFLTDSTKKSGGLFEVGGQSLGFLLYKEGFERIARDFHLDQILNTPRQVLWDIGDCEEVLLNAPNRLDFVEKGDELKREATIDTIVEYYRPFQMKPGYRQIYALATQVKMLIQKLEDFAHVGDFATRELESSWKILEHDGRAKLIPIAKISQDVYKMSENLHRQFLDEIYALKTLQEAEIVSGEGGIEALRYLIPPSKYGDAAKAVAFAAQKGLYKEIEPDQGQVVVAS